jgi:nitroreductase
MKESWFDQDQIRKLVEAATRAPSVLNTQPWIFEIGRDRIELFADPARRLEIVDSQGRQWMMSCGAALLNLRLAVLAAGWEAVVDVLPDARDDTHIASVGQGRSRVPSPDERALFASIPRRHTNRRPFSPERPKPEAIEEITRAAAQEGAVATVIGGLEALEVGDLVLEADREIRYDPAARAEIERWTRIDEERDDGVPLDAMGPVPHASHDLVRDFAFGQRADVRGNSDFEENPVLMLLSTPGDSRSDWVAAGQALQRVQLTATNAGLASSFLGQIFETRDLSGALERYKVAPGRPQMILRIGYGPEAPPTPRRPISEVIRERRLWARTGRR